MSTSPIVPASDTIAPRHVFPVLLVLVIQVALYIWMAPRGFEFTDESYYLHNYLHWREFTGTVTFFGAYFEWPFRLSGTSIAAMRVLSLLFVLASASILMRQVMRFAWRGQDQGKDVRREFWYLVAPMAAAMLFFGYLSTLRAPSYNLMCLATMALMSACVLSVMARRQSGRPTALVSFVYGLALGGCFLSKATTAASITLLHLVFFCAFNREWNWRSLLQVVLLVSAGFALNFLALSLLLPDWIQVLQEGMVIATLRDGSYSMWLLVNAVRWELQVQAPLIGPWLLGAALLLFVARKRIAGASPAMLSLLVVILVGTVPLSHLYVYRSKIWLIVTASAIAGLWFVERLAKRGRPSGYNQQHELGLTLLLLVSPFAFSFGTNMPVLVHSAIASLFAFCAVYLRLYRMADAGMLRGPALAIALVLPCIPAFSAQWLALNETRYTYRQTSALALQDKPLTLGTGRSVVRVDQRTESSIAAMKDMVQKAGMPSGQDVLDLTGDGPGVIYVIGAYPLGSPWMLGGFPGSSVAVERVIQKVDKERVRNAWLLVSSDNPRRVPDWREILMRRIGPDTHMPVESIQIVNPHAPGKNEPANVNLQLWKPVAANAPGATDAAPAAP